MKTKFLNIVLLEELPFDEIIKKIENPFNVRLPYENKKGRYIAEGKLNLYAIAVVDKFDDLGDFLCDEHHELKIIITYDDDFNYEMIENDVKEKLKNDIKWEYGIWGGAEEYLDKPGRKIYPEKMD
jgi:hypothetical protein